MECEAAGETIQNVGGIKLQSFRSFSINLDLVSVNPDGPLSAN